MICKLKRLFSKKEQKVKREAGRLKDFTRVTRYMDKIQQKRKDYIEAGTNQSIPLSLEIQRTDKKVRLGSRFEIDKSRFNRKQKKVFNRSLVSSYNKSKPDFIEDGLNIDKVHQIAETKRMIEENKLFYANLYVKQETKRQLNRHKRQQFHYIPEYQSIPYYKQQTDKLHQYNQCKSNLVNYKLDNILSNNSNQKLALLLQSGLLNNQQNIKEIMDRSLQKYQEQKQIQLNQNDSQQDQQQQIVQQQSEQQQVVQQQSDLQIIDQNRKELINYGFSIKSNELGYLDFDKLRDFYKMFIESNESEKEKILMNLGDIQKMKEYEKELFEMRQDTETQHDYNRMGETQIINYIHDSCDSVVHAFHLFENCEGYWNNVNVLSNLMIRLDSLKVRMQYTDQIGKMMVFNDQRYKKIFYHLNQLIYQQSNQLFVDTFHSIANMHKKELGIVVGNQFNKYVENVKRDILARQLAGNDVGYLAKALLNVPLLLADEQVQDRMVYLIKQQDFHDLVENNFQLLGMFQYLCHIGCNELVFQNIDILYEKQFFNRFDHKDFPDLVAILSKLSYRQTSLEKMEKLKQLIQFYETKLYNQLTFVNINQISNLSILLLNVRYFDEGIIARIKRVFQKKLMLNEKCLDVSIASNVVAMVHSDINNRFYDFKDNKVVERSLVFQQFQNIVLQQNSSYFVVYHEIVKNIITNKENYQNRSLLLILQSLGLIEYRNYEVVRSLIEHIYENNRDPSKLDNDIIVSFIYLYYQNNMVTDQYLIDFIQIFKEYNWQQNQNIKLTSQQILQFNTTLIQRDLFDDECEYFVDNQLGFLLKQLEYMNVNYLASLLYILSFLEQSQIEQHWQTIQQIVKLINKKYLNQNMDIYQYIVVQTCIKYLNGTSMTKLNGTSMTKLKFTDNHYARKQNQVQKGFITNINDYLLNEGSRSTIQNFYAEIQHILLEEGVKVSGQYSFAHQFIVLDISGHKIAIKLYCYNQYTYDRDNQFILKSFERLENKILQQQGYHVVSLMVSEYLQSSKYSHSLQDSKEKKKEYLGNVLKQELNKLVNR